MIGRFIPALLFLLLIGQIILPVHGFGPVIGVGNDAITPGCGDPNSPTAWLSEPVTAIGFSLREGQSVIEILAPFLAIVVLGIILIARREHRKGGGRPLLFWFATTAGLIYLGSAAVTFVQVFRVFHEQGSLQIDPIVPVFAIIGTILGIMAMRTARSPSSDSLKNRLLLAAIGIAGLVFWSGLIIGPVLSFCAAVMPARIEMPSWKKEPEK